MTAILSSQVVGSSPVAVPWRVDPESRPIMVESITETWPLVEEDGSESGRTGAFVCNTGDSLATANLIVHCVNNYAALRAVAQMVLDEARDTTPPELLRLAEAALAKDQS